LTFFDSWIMFCPAGDLNVLLREIMKEAQAITKAEKYVSTSFTQG